jgi:riboflavin kinase/FMN adenylyltransferase
MKVVRSLNSREVRQAPSVVLAMGVFDGVHIGHKKVIATVVREARRRQGTAVVLTFDPHPLHTIAGAGAPTLLTSIEHRLRLLSTLCLDLCIVIPFDGRMARLEARDFVVRRLLGSMDLSAMCVGPRFVFGYQRKGTVALLRKLGRQHGFSVIVEKGVRLGGMQVSSTAVRRMVRRADFSGASRLLGRPYSIVGDVVKGKALGRTLGIPTANVRTAGELLPCPGVYAVRVLHGARAFSGVLNIDFRGAVEVHLFDFRGTLYGEQVEVVMGKFIRREKRFARFNDLARQMRSDIAIAREMLHNDAVAPDPALGLPSRRRLAWRRAKEKEGVNGARPGEEGVAPEGVPAARDGHRLG